MKISSYLNIKKHVLLSAMTLIPIFLFINKIWRKKFKVSEALQKSELLMDVLYKKYYETLENGHGIDCEEVMEEEYLEISKKHLQ
jgi:hypothetical protein